MVEQLENGAGYTNYLASLSPEAKKKVFLNPLLPDGEMFKMLTNQNHINNCDSSCYDCIREYNNQDRHYILNWRLGLDLAAVSDNTDFVPDYAGDSSYWKGILDKSDKAFDKKGGAEIIKQEQFWYIKDKGSFKFIYHPLWSDTYIATLESQILIPRGMAVTYTSLLDFINNPQ